MNISYNWLAEYLPVQLDPEKLSQILTSVGLEVESMEKLEAVKGGLSDICIGKVMECHPHPNADKLKITKVDIGEQSHLNIVCGAPNVETGQTVVVAKVGATLYPLNAEPFQIKKAKIRGEESEGMICAEDEIGLGSSHDGIIVIPKDIPPGTSAADFYQLPESDYMYEIGLTPNRMDAMSHMGVAKDVCAYLSNKNNEPFVLNIPSANFTSSENDQKIASIEINIQDNQKCARYAGICIDNIKIQESPDWIQTRLKSIGLRPINNIVDITNFILHECGQPLHAFDLKAIKGNQINIKTVPDKTKFISLEGKERELSDEDLMICNSEEPMCIAGVFGGLHSGVSEQTTAIFLESAWFENNAIRKTSVKHGLRTDAAVRFEKGTDISNVIFALKRAAKLIHEYCGGRIISGIYDIYPTPFQERLIDIKFDKIRALSGKNYADAQIKNILLCLCFSIEKEDAAGLTIKVPFAKPDISLQADIVEEVMRIDGLDNIPFTGSISYRLPETTKAYTADVKRQFAQLMIGKGFQEIFTNSITNSSYYEEQDKLVMMMNSLSTELNCMRPSMLETGLVAVSYNLNRKNNQIKFFEFGKTYHRSENGFIENEKLCLYFSGHYTGEYWKQKEQKIDSFYVKGIIESLLYAMNPEWSESDGKLNLLFQRKKIGSAFLVTDEKQKQFDIKQNVWFVELDWETVRSYYEKQKPVFKGIPKFPIVKRDLALILDKHIQYEEVRKTVKQSKSKLLQHIHLFDVFESEKLGQNKKSYAINLSFYDDEKTLTDIEVEADVSMIIQSLESKLGAIIRS